MRQLLALFCIIFTLTACEGDQGPPGEDGGVIIAPAFEIEVDFNNGNNFAITQNYGFDIVPSDVVLIYISWETIDGTEVWRLLPQTAILDEGVLSYNYDFTDTDFSIFMDATFDLNSLDSSWTQNQYFRVVVVPADYINGIDTANYDDVVKAAQISEFKSL
ncbi:hypothetical protein [Formosa sp. A9]|uniref:hypothetical protein n=1 Tax=Formosa sp. A9 TaxID=3442641 RepID=UPI003EBADD7B